MLTSQLFTALRPMIGFRTDTQNWIDDEGTAAMTDSPSLLTSSSGVTVDQCHELLELETLYAAYQNNLSDFPAYLGRTRDDAIRSLLDNLNTKLAEVGLSARLLKPATLFTGSFGTPPMVIPMGRKVGLRLTALRTDVTVGLDRLFFYATFDEGFKLTLTNEQTGDSSQLAPGEGWTTTEWQLTKGYTYLLTYLETDLGVGNSASNTITQWPKPQKPNCKTCLNGCISSYVKIEPVSIFNGIETIDKTTNYGINLVLSADGDVSGRLADNPRRLLPLYRQQIALTFLNKIAYSNRKNPETEDAVQAALFALTDKDNANRVPILYDKAMASLIKSMQAEASSAIDVDQSDDFEWSSI